MVDPRTYIPEVNDSGKVLTFTTEEAIKYGYCEGKANSITEAIKLSGLTNYEIREYKLTAWEKMIGFLLNPALQGILIMLIIAGIYFELQTPGATFPIILAISAAVLYFAPLYMDGLAQNWEIILFILGIILVVIEIFAIPGFGVTGITGIGLIVVGLTFSLIDNQLFEFNGGKAFIIILRAMFLVVISMSLSLFLSIYLSGKIISNLRLQGLALRSEQKREQGYVSFEDKSNIIGKEGIAITTLRPSGKVEVEGEIYDALAETSYINEGERIIVNKYETGQLYVTKANQ